MRKISGILAIALILAACCVFTGLAKPEGRVKAENTGYTLQDSVFYEKKTMKNLQTVMDIFF